MQTPSKILYSSEAVLKVLKTLKDSPELTQREISQRAGISLGKVNFVLKALISNGLIKAHNFKNSENKKAYLYILTRSGIEEKARITCSFLARKIKEYEALEEEILILKKEVAELEASSDSEVSSI